MLSTLPKITLPILDYFSKIDVIDSKNLNCNNFKNSTKWFEVLNWLFVFDWRMGRKQSNQYISFQFINCVVLMNGRNVWFVKLERAEATIQFFLNFFSCCSINQQSIEMKINLLIGMEIDWAARATRVRSNNFISIQRISITLFAVR